MRKKQCLICKKKVPLSRVYPVDMMRDALWELAAKGHGLTERKGYICDYDRQELQIKHLTDQLQDETGKLSKLEAEVVESFKSQEILSDNTNEAYEGGLTLGERVADRVSAFGGSWMFIISFFCVLIGWMFLNSFVLAQDQFDPYPYILLNLVLSCLAAIQAPIIMMSQNRRSERDRIQAENDYKVNLKAELQIRHLNAKIDKILQHEWMHSKKEDVA
ncbi:MAG: DUF1003 domain-containing protein [Alphaproteobacteria bacterium]